MRSVQGVIYEESSSAVVQGASIAVKGTNRAVTSGPDGSYRIQAANSETLVFSYVGFQTFEVRVGDKENINVTLSKKTSSMDEVVVVGYGTVKKTDLTGSVSTVNMNDMLKAPVVSFAEALAGRAPGVQVSSQDGQPGVGMDIVVRGATSMTQSNAPLYVIDGFPIEDIEQASLNPQDIESINILKDASASAIYGSRAANGVVVIETKRGKIGKPVVSVNGSLGFQRLTRTMELMNPYEFVKYQFERNPTAAAIYFNNGKTLESYKDQKSIDMQDHLFRDAQTQIYDVAVRGGNDQTKYSLSGSVYGQDGIILNSDYKRYQGRFSIDQKINNKAKIGAIINYSNLLTNGAPIALGSTGDGQLTLSNNLFFTAWAYRPVAGNDSIDLLEAFEDPQYVDLRLNPIVATQNNYIKRTSSVLSGNVYLDYSFTNNLVLSVKGGVTHTNSRNDAFYNSRTNRGRPYSLNIRGVNSDVRDVESSVLSNENTLTYKKTFNSVHNLTALAGFSMQQVKSFTHGYSSMNIPNEALVMSGIDEGTPYALTSLFTENGLVSYFGRINYGYKSRYLLTATFRGDGSSKFAPGNKWGYFPSAAFAWNIHNESFMESVSFLSNAKLRITHGLTGNNRVGDFAYMPGLVTSSTAAVYPFNNATPNIGARATSMGNSQLKWETTAQTDLGMDLGLLKNRIEITVDWYRKITTDLLLNAQMPGNAGFTSAWMNIGKIENTGWEFGLNTLNVSAKSFSWTTGFNISFNRNKVLELVNDEQERFTNVQLQSQLNMPAYVSRIGEPMGQFWGLIHDGNYQYEDFDNPSQGVYTLKATVPDNGAPRAGIKPGDIKYKDLNGDLTVNSEDRAVIGSAVPKHIGGFVNNFTYKNFDLNVFFQWSYGNQLLNANRYFLEGNLTQTDAMNQFASYIDRWSPENPTNKNFRAGGQGPIAYSSRVIEDGSYLRLKTLSIGYNIPASAIRKMKINQVRIHASGNNLLTWTNYSGMDPEVSVRNSVLSPGFDFSAYPRGRTITFGLNVQF
ncbi:MAG: TonB-dependent receptor [Chitinophagaceae bacterium]|nr:TonB-dependent receptor [Chitinophagaceae bacterium]